MGIRYVHHINIVTPVLEATRRFCIDVLGLTEGFRPVFSSTGYWFYAGERPVVHIQQAEREVGPSSASVLNHFAFEVDDFDGMIERLERHGVPYRALTIAGTRIRQAFFEEPSGCRMEISCDPDGK